MLKSLEISTPTSCLNKSQDNEPLFVLTARDVIAPHAVRQWAQLYAQLKTSGTRNMTNKERLKYNEAMAAALQMELWRTAPQNRQFVKT